MAGEAVELPSSALALLRDGVVLLRVGNGAPAVSGSPDVPAAEAARILNVRDEYVETLVAHGELSLSEDAGEPGIPPGSLLAYK